MIPAAETLKEGKAILAPRPRGFPTILAAGWFTGRRGPEVPIHCKHGNVTFVTSQIPVSPMHSLLRTGEQTKDCGRRPRRSSSTQPSNKFLLLKWHCGCLRCPSMISLFPHLPDSDLSSEPSNIVSSFHRHDIKNLRDALRTRSYINHVGQSAARPSYSPPLTTSQVIKWIR